MQKLVGQAVSELCLQKVASQAQRLSGLQPRDHRAVAETNGDIYDVEFGADLAFHPPSRFLVDMSVENGELLDEETSTSFSSVHAIWQDEVDYKHSHKAGGGRNYDLSWLRDACDGIVKGNSSSLSRDELAMAICRVLDSDKPGEEVSVLVSFLSHLVNETLEAVGP